jgi:tetratricopeptide (TPR) repeat protein
MSLLLEALKKAEKAKEEAKRRAEHGAEGSLAPTGGETAGAGDRHVVTRNELPDISQPLEIVSEAFSPSEPVSRRPADPAPVAIESARELPPRRTPSVEPATPAAPQAAAQSAARNLFEAKFKEPNPKLPFYITMGVLGAFAVGTVVYFWLQLRPPALLVNTNPARPANERTVEPSMLAKPAAMGTETQATATAAQIPGLPARAAQPTAAASEPAKPASVAIPVPATQAPAPPAASPAKPSRKPAQQDPATAARAPRAAPAEAVRPRVRTPVTTSRAAPQVNPRVDQGYAAYNSGDFAAARAAYLDTLRDEPANRDALLGMAAVEVRAGRLETADGYYRQLLRADPRDADAHAGLLALRSDQVDPVRAESRLKNLLIADPDAHVLHFTLGNQYAQQGRWAEAQQSYFKAFSADSGNPDYAYNLAVSLDQLRQPRFALDYYRRALALAQTRAASFDQGLARNRAQTLAQAAR